GRDVFVPLECAKKGRPPPPPLLVQGKELRVNFRSNEGGSLRVAILDDRGKPVAGFAADDCDPFTGDAVSHTMRWQKNSSLSGLAGKPARLRFELVRGHLWSFRFGN